MMKPTIRGVTYADVPTAAAALGVGKRTVYRAFRTGTEDNVGLGRARPVTIDGVKYATQVDAARALGVARVTIYKRVKQGIYS